MKVISYVLLFLTGITSYAQQSVFEDVSVTQAIIDGAGPLYRKNKVLFPANQNFLFTGSSNQEIRVITSIKVEGGNFKAGPYTSGQMKLRVVPTPLDIVVMNYPSMSGILLYEKLELGIALPPDILAKVNNYLTGTPGATLNPFVEWDLRIIADFTHVPTGFTKSVDAFYFRNMQHGNNNSWVDAGTGYPFRVRYSPPKTGQWQCSIRVIVGGNPAILSETFPFNVISSSNPGYATIHANKNQFVRGGSLFYPLGTNLPFPGGGITAQLDYSALNDTYLQNYPLYAWTDYLARISAYGDQGGRYIRVINCPSSSEIEFEKLGNYYDRLKFANEMDALLDICHQKGILIDFNLMLHTPIMKSGDYGHYGADYGTYTPDGPSDPSLSYCYSKDFNNSVTPSDMINNPEAFKYIKQRYRYYISRYGYSTDIYMFELLSEPWHMNEHAHQGNAPYLDNTADGTVARQAVQTFHSELSSYIKNYLQHNEHLIGAMGMLTAFSQYPDALANSTHDNSWALPGIDVICMSNYAGAPDGLIVSKQLGSGENNGFSPGENSNAHHIHIKHEVHNKPVFLSETGWGDGITDCAGWKGHKIAAMEKAYLGLAGFNMWEGWTYPDQYNNNNQDMSWLWPSVIMAQNHANDATHKYIYSTAWTQGRQYTEDKVKEHQYIISGDKEDAEGYVFNRTYNAYTLRSSPSYCDLLNDGISGPNNPEWNAPYVTPANLDEDEGGYLMVEGLNQNTKYRVTWYRYSDGSEWYTQCSETGIGSSDFKLRHPELIFSSGEDAAAPLYWYKIEKADCAHPQNRLAEATGITTGADPEFSTVSLSPNPTRDRVEVTSDFMITSYTITDLLGKEILYHVNASNLLTIDLSGFAPGVYSIRLNNLNDVYKIVKL
jgi:hypothetical protein